jgi:hypothetical protein
MAERHGTVLETSRQTFIFTENTIGPDVSLLNGTPSHFSTTTLDTNRPKFKITIIRVMSVGLDLGGHYIFQLMVAEASA